MSSKMPQLVRSHQRNDFSTYSTSTITIANGATTGKESSIGIPSNFIPMGVMVAVTGAANNVNSC